MSSWLGGGFSSITGQISNLTKDILAESTEEVIDHETQLKVSNAKVTELKAYCTSQKLENERLTSIIKDLEEKTESSELQINRISSEYRSVIKEKENEIKLLKQKQHELIQQQAKSVRQSLEQKEAAAPHNASFQQSGYVRASFEGDGVDFGDNIGLQHELNRLSQENQSLQVACQHWKELADQKVVKGQEDGDESNKSKFVQLQIQVKELQKQLTSEKEAQQHEVASLQDLYMEKISTLKKKQKQEKDDYMETIGELEYTIEDLQQKLSKTQDWDSGDWEDWNQKGHQLNDGDPASVKREYKELQVSYKKVKDELNSLTKEHSCLQESYKKLNDEINTLRQQFDNLNEQYKTIKQENEKFEVDNFKLQDLLNENECEVNSLKTQMDEQREKNDSATKQATIDVEDLKAMIEKKENEISAIKSQNEQTADELYNTKQKLLDQMDANHADALDILSDVRGVKRQMDENSLERKYKLIDKKKFIIDHLLLTGQKQREIDKDIKEAIEADAVVSAETVSVLSSMGDMDHQRLTGEIVDTMEQENSVLKEHNLHLQEQVTLLQKTVSTLTDERQESIENVRRLKERISELTGEKLTSSDGSDVTVSKLNATTDEASNISDLSKSNEDLQQQVKALSKQVEKYQEEVEQFELIKTDFEMEKESLQEVLVNLREQLKEKDNIIKNTEIENTEIKNKISSLHDKNAELENSLQSLSSTKDNSEEMRSLQAEVEHLKTKIYELQEEIRKKELENKANGKLVNKLDQQTEIINDLQEKIKNGGLALNELHMDKKELEDSLKKCKADFQNKSRELVEYKKESSEKYRILELEMDHSVKNLEELKENLNAAKQRPRSLTPDISESQKEISNVRDINIKLQNENDLLQKKLLKLESDKIFMEESLEESEKKYDSFKDQLEKKAHKTHDDLNKQIEVMKVEKDTLEKALGESEQKLEELQNEYQSKLDTLQRTNNTNAKKLEEEIHNSSKLKLEKTKIMNDMKKEIDNLSSDLNGTKDILNTTLSNHKEISELLQQKEKEIVDLKKEQMNLMDQRDELSVQVNDLQITMHNVRDMDRRTSSSDEQNQSIKSELEHEESKNDKTSDTSCSNDKTLDIITDLESELNTSNNTISSLRNELDKLSTSQDGKENYISELNSIVKQHEKTIDECRNKIVKQEDEIVKLNKNISTQVEELVSVSTALSNQKAAIENYKSLLFEKEKTIETHAASVANYEKHSSESQNEIKHLKTMIEDLHQKLVKETQNEKLILDKVRNFESEILDADCQKSGGSSQNESHSNGGGGQSLGSSFVNGEEVREQTSSNLHKGSCFIDIEATSKNLLELDNMFILLKQRYFNNCQAIAMLVDRFKQIMLLLDRKQRLHLPDICDAQFLNQFFTPNFISDLLEKDSVEIVDKCSAERSLVSFETTNIVNEDIISKQEARLVSSDRIKGSADDLDYNDEWEERAIDITEQLERLQGVIQQKDGIISELQQTNSSLLKLIDKPNSSSLIAEKHLVDKDKLENEIRSLKNEKEQILAVMNEKSRECSNYKTEVNRLMNIVSAQKSALDKALLDNNYLVQANEKKSVEKEQHTDKHLSNLIRDKDLEIESLKQKNETLLAVIQDSSSQSDGNKINTLLKEKDALVQKIQSLESERDQVLVCVNQKHQENISFYNEIQRLSSLYSSENDAHQRLKDDYSNIIVKFKEQKEAFVEVQNELIQCKTKFTDLEMKYGELLQKSGAKETVNIVEYNSKVGQVNSLQDKLREANSSLSEKEEAYQSLYHKSSELENSLTKIELERNLLKKQYENVKSQFQGLQSELSDLEVNSKSSEQKTSEQMSEMNEIKLLNNQFMLSVKEKDVEISSLKDMINTLNAVVQEKQGEQSQLKHMMQENESIHKQLLVVQCELDSTALQVKQANLEKQEIISETDKLKEKDLKQRKELDRLRGHLVEIEDGYTREALVAEEREKNLRNRLNSAEEKLHSSTTAVVQASQQANMQLESLQQQLHIVISQRDEAYLQLAQLQEQCQQQAVSIANLQLVLEQFQQEKETLVSMETEKYERENKTLQKELTELKQTLDDMTVKVQEAEDGLEAAARLSEQMDRRGDEIIFLRKEVHHKEQCLKEAEGEIRKLTSGTEAKVDKILIKNLLLGYFHTPQNKRNEVIRLLGSVLAFEKEDFMQIYGDNRLSWVPGFLRFGQKASPHSISRSPIDHTFSELFVKFLEQESTPRPVPAILPAEEMAKDLEKKYKDHHRDPAKTTPNPFTAPRHVALPMAVGGRSSPHESHPLMAPLSPQSLPVLNPFSLYNDSDSSGNLSRSETPPTSTSILKDVLGSK